MADGSNDWGTLHHGLPEAPAIRALAVHPLNPESSTPARNPGPYRSSDRGERWEKSTSPTTTCRSGHYLFHPYDPDVMFVGYENCEIYRSDDAGERWLRLPVSGASPKSPTAPGANPPSVC